MPTCLRWFAKNKANMIFTLIIVEEWMFFPKIKN